MRFSKEEKFKDEKQGRDIVKERNVGKVRRGLINSIAANYN